MSVRTLPVGELRGFKVSVFFFDVKLVHAALIEIMARAKHRTKCQQIRIKQLDASEPREPGESGESWWGTGSQLWWGSR